MVFWCEEVLVGYVGVRRSWWEVLVWYVGVESDDVYGDKPHPVPEWSVVVVPFLKRM